MKRDAYFGVHTCIYIYIYALTCPLEFAEIKTYGIILG